MSWLLLVDFVFDIHVVNLQDINSGCLGGHSNSTEISHQEKLKHCTKNWAEVYSAARPHHNFFFALSSCLSCYQYFSALCPIVFGQLKIEKK
jgi:hypothetical protein